MTACVDEERGTGVQAERDDKYNRRVSPGHDLKRAAHVSLGAAVFIQSKCSQLNNLMPSSSQCIATRQIKNNICGLVLLLQILHKEGKS